MHLVGFIIKKFVTMHGHTNVKKNSASYIGQHWTEKYLHVVQASKV